MKSSGLSLVMSGLLGWNENTVESLARASKRNKPEEEGGHPTLHIVGFNIVHLGEPKL